MASNMRGPRVSQQKFELLSGLNFRFELFTSLKFPRENRWKEKSAGIQAVIHWKQ
eukprot:m.349119 g.349119  ORF g.349119 m.349119 type:complete len:55 (-) comp16567_c1_seq1:306-470(-)